MITEMQKKMGGTIVEIVAPALIMIMTGSLAFFFVELFYYGSYTGRVKWVLGLFVFATVLVSRLSIMESAGKAIAYGFVLALATILVLALIGGVNPLLGLLLTSVVIYVNNKLTWDCTVIDHTKDSTDRGLLERVGLEPNANSDSSSSERNEKSDRREGGDEPSPEPAAWTTRFFKKKKPPNTPGVWVIYLALAAFPIYGLGQGLITEEIRRQNAFFDFCLYLIGALGLLVTTAMLGLQRYLVKRNATMPNNVAITWVGTGVVMIAAILIAAWILPRPYAEFAYAENPFKFERKSWWGSSKYSVGNEGKKEGGSGGNKQEKSDTGGGNSQQKNSSSKPNQSARSKTNSQTDSNGSRNSSGKQSGGQKSQGSKSQGSKSQSKSSGAESSKSQSETRRSGAKEGKSKSSQKSDSKNAKSNPNQNGDRNSNSNENQKRKSRDSQDQNPSNENQGSNGESNGKAEKNSKSERKSPQNSESREKKSGSKASSSRGNSSQTSSGEKSNESNSNSSNSKSSNSNSSRPNSMQLPSFSGIAWIVQVLFWIIAAIVILYFAWRFRQKLYESWLKFLDDLRNFWAGLFGKKNRKKDRARNDFEPTTPVVPPVPFSAFSNPYTGGQASTMSQAQLIKYTFEALEAWGRERGISRGEDETPHEFAISLTKLDQSIARQAKILADNYCAVAFSPQPTTDPSTPQHLSKLWMSLSDHPVSNSPLQPA